MKIKILKFFELRQENIFHKIFVKKWEKKPNSLNIYYLKNIKKIENLKSM